MPVHVEGRHPAEFILSEAEGHRSRDNVTVAAEQAIDAGTIIALLAQPASVAVSAAANAGNTGTGALTMAEPAVDGRVKNGTYRVVCVEPATASGRFSVEDPEGVTIGTAVVGTPFEGEIKFSVADGDPDFVAGDNFTVKVVFDPRTRLAVAFDPTASDGAERPAGIAIYAASTGESETIDIAALVRAAEVNGRLIAWPEGITDAQTAAATTALRALGIVAR
jgi:hypothetical protein